ncbi:MAG: DUF2225 domain-containing protein [Spirochaetales bacterium]|nr:DUF2225 domain-containing protein [Spirochaetales bacterium]
MNPKITFFSKDSILCPVCQATFFEEKLQTGRGRLIAGELSLDLRRKYEPSKKYGEVSPLIYPILVCPECFYAAFNADFREISPETSIELSQQTESRISSIRLIFDDVDFREIRTWKEGIASYFLAMMCYDFFPKIYSPLIKRGVCALRCAWLLSDLHRKLPNDNFDYLARIFYRKARFYYVMSVEYEGNGRETISHMNPLGPDTDKNYGYDGVLYLSAYLDYLYGPRKNAADREKALLRAKTTLARIFGMGKATKDKPSAILDLAKELHGKINADMKTADEDEEV